MRGDVLFSITALAIGSLAVDARAQEREGGLQMWHPSDLKTVEASMVSKIPANRSYATQDLSVFGNNVMRMVYSTGTGRAEVHDHDLVICLVESGEGTLISGGTVLNPSETRPGETRGTGIEGGEHYELHTGDIVKLPPKRASQVIVTPGKTLTLISIHIHME